MKRAYWNWSDVNIVELFSRCFLDCVQCRSRAPIFLSVPLIDFWLEKKFFENQRRLRSRMYSNFSSDSLGPSAIENLIVDQFKQQTLETYSCVNHAVQSLNAHTWAASCIGILKSTSSFFQLSRSLKEMDGDFDCKWEVFFEEDVDGVGTGEMVRSWQSALALALLSFFASVHTQPSITFLTTLITCLIFQLTPTAS